jgi:hypothetical protein
MENISARSASSRKLNLDTSWHPCAFTQPYIQLSLLLFSTTFNYAFWHAVSVIAAYSLDMYVLNSIKAACYMQRREMLALSAWQNLSRTTCLQWHGTCSRWTKYIRFYHVARKLFSRFHFSSTALIDNCRFRAIISVCNGNECRRVKFLGWIVIWIGCRERDKSPKFSVFARCPPVMRFPC